MALDSDAETLRGSALTVSGTRAAVEAYARGRDVLHTEALGFLRRAVVRSAGDQDRHAAHALGLSVEPTSLQQLVVALSRGSDASAARPTDPPVRLEEVS